MRNWYLLFAIIAAAICLTPAAYPMEKLCIKKDVSTSNSNRKLKKAFNEFLLSKGSDEYLSALSLSEKNVSLFITLCMEKPLDKTENKQLASALYNWASLTNYDYTKIDALLKTFFKDPNGFIKALRQTANIALDEAIRTENPDAAARAIIASGGNTVVKRFIKNNKLDAIRKLTLMNINLKPLMCLKNLVKNTNTNNISIREKRRHLFYLLLEQVPVELFPSLDDDKQKYFACDPRECKTLQKLKTRKEFKKWIYYDEELIDLKRIPLFLCGNAWQLKETVEHGMLELSARRNSTLAAFCVLMLRINAFTNFLRLLSLCVQQQIAQPWMFEKERANDPKKRFFTDEAQLCLLKKLKKYPWARQITGFKTAFAPLRTQNRLKKILKKQKMVTEFEDVKLVFSKTSVGEHRDKHKFEN